jgi:hypothetical protein
MQGTVMEHNERKSRTGIEVGTVVVILIFMLGLSFQAGIQYGDTQNLKTVVAVNRSDIDKFNSDSNTITERLARVEAILSDIRAELERKENR